MLIRKIKKNKIKCSKTNKNKILYGLFSRLLRFMNCTQKHFTEVLKNLAAYRSLK